MCEGSLGSQSIRVVSGCDQQLRRDLGPDAETFQQLGSGLFRELGQAAVEVFSERGFWNTPTSLVSKTAGVADGTLFTYFNTLYPQVSSLW